MTRYRLLPAAALVLLAACGDKEKPQEGRLQGEVLEGTISDEMVQFDQVRSQAPLAESVDDGGSSGESAAPAVRSGDEAAGVDAAQPTPTPAETPVTTTDGQPG